MLFISIVIRQCEVVSLSARLRTLYLVSDWLCRADHRVMFSASVVKQYISIKRAILTQGLNWSGAFHSIL